MKGASMNGYKKRVLIVEEAEDDRIMLSEMLENVGYKVHTASDEHQALEEMKRRRFDVMVATHHMPHINGVRLVLFGRLVWPGTPIILVWGDDTSLSEIAEHEGAYGTLRKPYDSVELLELMGSAIQFSREHRSQIPKSFWRPADDEVDAKDSSSTHVLIL
jgi:DNA-binding NtrC family response regulator